MLFLTLFPKILWAYSKLNFPNFGLPKDHAFRACISLFACIITLYLSRFHTKTCRNQHINLLTSSLSPRLHHHLFSDSFQSCSHRSRHHLEPVVCITELHEFQKILFVKNIASLSVILILPATSSLSVPFWVLLRSISLFLVKSTL